MFILVEEEEEEEEEELVLEIAALALARLAAEAFAMAAMAAAISVGFESKAPVIAAKFPLLVLPLFGNREAARAAIAAC